MDQYINHVALVLDASGSMAHLKDDVIKLADSNVEYLAKRSVELDQETRITVYKFGEKTECLVYDKDVLRLPSMRKLYDTDGRTVLIDATLKSIEDLLKTATLYGNHAFLVYVITDGYENRSMHIPEALNATLNALPDNWTIACLVPDKHSQQQARSFGFLPGNVAIWDAQDAAGVKELGNVIQQATDTFMQNRALNIHGSKNLFQLDAANIDTSKLVPLVPAKYKVLNVDRDIKISDFVEAHLGVYHVGTAYYQLVKPEDVQGNKNVLVVKNKTGEVFASKDARKMLGLPEHTIRVSPVAHPEYTIFVQSTSYTRKLPANTNLLVLA